MDDDNIKDIFKAFNPDLSSTDGFMERLKRNMEAVELVKKHNRASFRRNKTAIAISAAAGFVAGMLTTMLMPLVSDWFSTVRIMLPYLDLGTFIVDWRLAAWIAVGGVSVIVALNTYDVAIARLAPKDEHP